MAAPEYTDLQDAELLNAAFARVRTNKGVCGSDNITIEAFEAALDDEISALINALANNTYTPAPFLKASLKRPGKSPRQLVIPTVRDRVLHTAIAMRLLPLMEAEFEHCSYGYRPQRSYKMAVCKVGEYREQGFHWVVDADIEAYFDSIQQHLLLYTLKQYVKCDLLRSLIANCLFTPQFDANQLVFGLARGMGIPQGSPLSPMLANLYLDAFDEALLQHGFKCVRYADDFVVLTRSRPDAEHALQVIDTQLHALQLTLNNDKTQITSFEEGFSFLGHAFINDLILDEKSQLAIEPEPESELAAYEDANLTFAEPDIKQTPEQEPTTFSELSADIADAQADKWFTSSNTCLKEEKIKLTPRLKTLYVSQQGAVISKKGLRAITRFNGKELSSVPFGTLDAMVLLGRVQITSDTLGHCMQHNIPLIMAT